MKVKCINQNNYKDITVGNEYEVVGILENFYHITADSGNVRSYNKKYFEVIPEPVIEDVDEEPAGRKGGNVIDLMAALKKSAGEGARKPPAAKKATPKKAGPRRKSA